jgi:hypothetical protein
VHSNARVDPSRSNGELRCGPNGTSCALAATRWGPQTASAKPRQVWHFRTSKHLHTQPGRSISSTTQQTLRCSQMLVSISAGAMKSLGASPMEPRVSWQPRAGGHKPHQRSHAKPECFPLLNTYTHSHEGRYQALHKSHCGALKCSCRSRQEQRRASVRTERNLVCPGRHALGPTDRISEAAPSLALSH